MTPPQAHEAAQRVMARCDILAAISEQPDQLTRVYLSPQHREANALVALWMAEAGMETWQDAVGNVCGRYEAAAPGAPALLLGSHLDSVRNAGRYDGPLGVMCAIELVDWLNRHQVRGQQAIEVVGFADEEGTRFGITLLGSRGLCGTWADGWLETTDESGISVASALAQMGLDGARIHEAVRPAGTLSAYLELHIEQGPVLEQEGLALGVVTAINGAKRLNCRFTGLAGHAGTVPMAQRQDALAGAAEWIGAIEQITRAQPGSLVATVGMVQCHPGAVNVIPGEVTLSLDIRGPQDDERDRLLAILLDRAQEIAARRRLAFSAQVFYTSPATPCAPPLQQQLAAACEAVQGQVRRLPSGAGHDAMAMAGLCPAGMLFVRCAGGISHHPAESVLTQDVALAINAYSRAAYGYLGLS